MAEINTTYFNGTMVCTRNNEPIWETSDVASLLGWGRTFNIDYSDNWELVDRLTQIFIMEKQAQRLGFEREGIRQGWKEETWVKGLTHISFSEESQCFVVGWLLNESYHEEIQEALEALFEWLED